MKQRIATLFAFLFISIITSQCKKDMPPDTLPPNTQIGANTFGCKINGQVWVPYFPCDLGPGTELEYTIGSTYTSTALIPLRFSMQAQKTEDPYSGTFIITPAFLRSDTTGSYIYSIGNVADSMSIDFRTDADDYWAVGDPNDIFQIIKLDTVNKIVSGTFSFTLYDLPSNRPSDSIVVTDGRFDFRFGVYARCSR